MTDDETHAAVRLPLLLVLASLAAVAPVATDLYLPGFPAMGAELNASPSGVQLTLTTFLIGLAVGQLVMGPLSDRYGRRRPLIASASVCVAASAVCALAPSLPVLISVRLIQGLAGAGGMVIGRAVIADIVTGRAAAKAYTLMLTVGGIAPVMAPLVGGLLSDPVGWRGMLWTVTALCAAMLLGVVLVLHETLPRDQRTVGQRSTVAAMRTVAGNHAYRGPVLVFALSFGVMMGYISSSPFVYQNVVGLSEAKYGAAFGTNMVGLIAVSLAASRLVDRWSPVAILRTSIAVQLAGTLTFVVLALIDAPTWLLPLPIFVAVASNGGIMGNAAALAMAEVRPVAGAGSAILGFSQFALGAVVSPLVGLGGEDSAVVPAVVMAGSSLLGFVVSRTALHPGSERPPDEAVVSSSSTL